MIELLLCLAWAGLLPAWTGVLLLRALGPSCRSLHPLTRVVAGAAFGLGLSSLLAFVLLHLPGFGPGRLWLAAPIAVAALYLLARRQRGQAPAAQPSADCRIHPGLRLGCGLALLAAAWVFVWKSQLYPHSEGDALLIWNLRARFIFLSGEAWAQAFAAGNGCAHLDYPLFLPLGVVQLFSLLGAALPAAPIVLAAVTSTALAGLLFAALIRGGKGDWAAVGLLLLLGTAFVEYGPTQYADVSLSLFMLLSLVLIQAADERAPGAGTRLAALAGAAAALAAWTKNEGILFLLCFLLARLRHAPALGVPALWRRDRWILLGCLPVLLVLVWFKLSVGSAGDVLLRMQEDSSWNERLLDPRRSVEILSAAGRSSLLHGYVLVPGILLLGGLVWRRTAGAGRREMEAMLLCLGLCALGYFLVYQISSDRLDWHLRSSMDRLQMQLLPGLIFACLLPLARRAEPGSGQ